MPFGVKQRGIGMFSIGRGVHDDHEANGEAPEYVQRQESFLLLHVDSIVGVAAVT